MEEFVAKQADKALKNKVLSSGSEVFLTAKLATDGVDFFTVPSGSVTFVRILLLRCVHNENNGPRINRSSSKASTGNFSQGLTSRAYPKELSFVQQLLVGFPLLSEELFQRCLSFQE